jgi:hypothetical protein
VGEFDRACESYDAEVRRVAAELVRTGAYAPWVALQEAGKIVRERRRAKALLGRVRDGD